MLDKNAKKLIADAWRDIKSYPLLASVHYFKITGWIVRRQVLPLVSATIIDSASSGKIGLEWKTLLLMVIASEMFSYLLGISSRRAQHDLNEKTMPIRYARYTRQMMDLPYDTITNLSKGDLLQKVRKKAEFSQDFLNFSLDIPRAILNTAVSFVVLLSRSKGLAVAYLALWFPMVFMLYRISRKRVGINKVANQAWDTYQAELSDIVTNAETIKQFGRENQESKRILDIGKPLWHSFTRRWKAARQQQAMVATLDTVLQIAFASYGLYALTRGNISVGTFALVAAYIGNTMADIDLVSNLIRNTSESLTQATALDEVQDRNTGIFEPKKPVKPGTHDSSVVLRNATFIYSDSQDAAIENMNLNIPSKQKIGIVGKSGSGKSTLSKLILRLYSLNDGELIVCGKNVDSMGSNMTKSLISYVPQEPVLFHRSVRENIIYGNESINKQTLKHAIKQAYVDEFAQHLPNGLDTLVGDRGVRLSGGQRQRVAIARAIIKDAPILLFDEATSALDSESESYIQKALQNIMKDKTAIVIAHRLSTLKNMDRIIVLDKGKIVQDGSHSDLINQDGLYAKLWQHQSGGFIED